MVLKDYIVVEQSTKELLRKEVKKKLKDGWKLQGGATTSLHAKPRQLTETGYLQTLVKYIY